MTSRQIPLTRGYTAVVDEEDYADLMQHKWQASDSAGGVYARRTTRGVPPAYMHRSIMGATEPSVVVDHINGDTLDNRRSNLQVVTQKQNTENRRRRSGRGVSFYKPTGKWRAYLTDYYQQMHLGYFNTKEEAENAAAEGRRTLFTNSKESTNA